jgi:hypothetical protein
MCFVIHLPSKENQWCNCDHDGQEWCYYSLFVQSRRTNTNREHDLAVTRVSHRRIEDCFLKKSKKESKIKLKIKNWRDLECWRLNWEREWKDLECWRARDLVREREKGNSKRGVLFCIAARARIVGEGFHIGGNLAVCENLITLFQLNYRIATVFSFSSFTYDIHSPDVKCLNQKSFL